MVHSSCLCGDVRWEVDGDLQFMSHCHCGRCGKARSAAHASNVFTAADGVRYTRGENLLASYKVPDAQFFTQVFCRTCGGKLPRIDKQRGLAVIPMGALDDNPGFTPQSHIFVGSKAPWFEISDDLPQFDERPV